MLMGWRGYYWAFRMFVSDSKAKKMQINQHYCMQIFETSYFFSFAFHLLLFLLLFSVSLCREGGKGIRMRISILFFWKSACQVVLRPNSVWLG
jgi:hypothetical protein